MNRTQNIEVAVDAIVFGYSKEEGVSILLIKRKYDPIKVHGRYQADLC